MCDYLWAGAYDQLHLMDAEHNLALEQIWAMIGGRSLTSILDVGCKTCLWGKHMLNKDFCWVNPS